MNSKNFFFFAAAIGILILAGDKIYRLWQLHHDEQVMQAQLIENRKQMDKFYMAEFERIYKTYINGQGNCFRNMHLNNSIKAIEAKMVHDGYNNAEAGLIQQQALSRINSHQR